MTMEFTACQQKWKLAPEFVEKSLQTAPSQEHRVFNRRTPPDNPGVDRNHRKKMLPIGQSQKLAGVARQKSAFAGGTGGIETQEESPGG